MADPISLTIGAVALAGLFSTCVECFDYFIAAKSFREDLEILLVKLDLEKTRLLIWGNSVGVLRTKDEPEGRAAELDDVPKVQLIARCLDGVKSLLSDADKLQGRYGLQRATGKRAKNSGLVSSNSMNVFKTSYSRFWVRFAKDENKTSVLSRTKWAIHDKANFEGLINDMKDLIDGLNEVLPVQRESQDLLVRRDISSILDITTLRLIQSACEGSYRSWSDEASRVIEESERGTIDRRHVEEWIRDAEGIDELNPNEQAQMSIQPRKYSLEVFDLKLETKTKIYLILTAKCLNLATERPCSQTDLGIMTLGTHGHGFEAVQSRQWSLSRRILDTINVAAFTNYDFDQTIVNSGSFMEDIIKEALMKEVPVATLYIYCSTCACQIRTALSIHKYNDTKNLLHIRVRPDDRLIATCCSNATRTDGLSSLIMKMNEYEAGQETQGISMADLETLDRQWIEQRLFQIEQDMPHSELGSQASAVAQSIFAGHEKDRKCAGIVMLGETDQLSSIIQTAPFPATARMPREREIYHLAKSSSNSGWTRTYLGTFVQRFSTARKGGTISSATSSTNISIETLGTSFTHGSSISLPLGPLPSRPKSTSSILEDSEKNDEEDDTASTKT